MEQLFTEQESRRLGRYYHTLRSIHDRLVIEGYFLDGGKVWNIFKVGIPGPEVEWDE